MLQQNLGDTGGDLEALKRSSPSAAEANLNSPRTSVSSLRNMREDTESKRTARHFTGSKSR
eukprot:5428914-Amphidinium_carterae.2